ncbi:transposase [Clostridioides difficile T11]|nr:transposase [Clostridioides difficile T11]CCL30106.1 transposase [Clostridioides difficile E15]
MSFYMAIEDNYVRKNLFDFQLSEVIEDASRPKTALSKVQEARLLDLYSHASDAENARSVA